VSKDYKILKITPSVYSLHFMEGLKPSIELSILELRKLFPAGTEITNTFNRINLIFPNEYQMDDVVSKVSEIDFNMKGAEGQKRTWKIPICFDSIFPNDLVEIYDGNPQKINAYRAVFLATTFRLEWYGFLPGFGYLSGLPKELHLDRKRNPSPLTRKGTVGVGGAQVGVYPQDSPGGWQNLGNCPLPWINFLEEPYVFITVGDSVRFYEVDLTTHKKIALSVKRGNYQPNYEHA